MEFIQFHPTALYQPGKKASFLITEALRGSGAKLLNLAGEAFMERYDTRLELAPRDIVARAIDNEMKIRGEDYVLLDCTHIHSDEIINHFPNIYARCLKSGIDITKEPIPVVPSCHYMCGGILVDEWAQTSIKNLLAIGECASTGLHGANRLASNSLLEALVFSHRASELSIKLLSSIEHQHSIPEWNIEGTADAEELILITQSRKELQSIMSNYVGIVRSKIRLNRAFERMKILNRETEELYQRTTLTVGLCELRNLIQVGYLITKAALYRPESVGLHYMVDYHESEIAKE
jgi:L-aspartate oxidase